MCSHACKGGVSKWQNFITCTNACSDHAHSSNRMKCHLLGYTTEAERDLAGFKHQIKESVSFNLACNTKTR